jgi:hypothetical protein
MWPDRPAGERADALVDRGRELEHAYSDRRAFVRRMFALYETGRQSERAGRYKRHRQMRRMTSSEACDAFASEVAGNPPALQITLRDAGVRALEQARYYQWYQDAARDEQRLPSLYLRATKDAWCTGMGWIVCRDYDDGPRLERVHPEDVLIDDAGCDGGAETPELLIRHEVSRARLIADYPDQAVFIEQAPTAPRAMGRDVVLCYEGWWADRRHVLACCGVRQPLVDEAWEGVWPASYLVLLSSDRGMWGLSLMDRVASLQVARNYCGVTIQRGLRWHVPRLLADGDAIEEGEITDDTRHIVRVNGSTDRVKPLVMPAAAPDIYAREQWLDDTIQRAGMATELFSGGLEGDKTTSGRHLQLKRDMSTRKLLPQYNAVAAFGERLLLELVRGEGRVADQNPDYLITVKVSGITKNILPSILELDTSSLQVRAQSAGALPLDPSSRMEALDNLHDRGVIDADEYLAKSDIVEFEQSRRRKTAHVDLIDGYIEDILLEGVVRYPRKLYIKLHGPRMLREATDALMRADSDFRHDLQSDEVDEERKTELRTRLESLEKWISWVAQTMRKDAEEQAAQAAQAAMMAGPMGAPPPGPMGAPPPPGGGELPTMDMAPPGGNVVPMVRP